jgi:hypothetical protein
MKKKQLFLAKSPSRRLLLAHQRARLPSSSPSSLIVPPQLHSPVLYYHLLLLHRPLPALVAAINADMSWVCVQGMNCVVAESGGSVDEAVDDARSPR